MNTPGTHVAFFGISDTGLMRENNEDHFTVADLTLKVVGVQDNQVTPALLYHEVGAHGTIVAVADGLGGYEGGEIASQIAVEATVQALFETDHGYRSTTQWLADAVGQAHAAICQHQQTTASHPRMGSTLTAVHIGHGVLTIAQVGDSRAYKFSNGQLTLLTEDQTLINMMQKKGMVTDQEAQNHPHRHIVLQALGQGKTVCPEVHSYSFQDGDYILLCTDGLSSYVDQMTIQSILAEDGDEPTHCQRLIDASYASGGADNVTVLLARLMSYAAEATAIIRRDDIASHTHRNRS